MAVAAVIAPFYCNVNDAYTLQGYKITILEVHLWKQSALRSLPEQQFFIMRSSVIDHKFYYNVVKVGGDMDPWGVVKWILWQCYYETHGH